MLRRVTCDAQEGFLCVTIKLLRLGNVTIYSALVNSVFVLINFLFFGINLTFVYKYTICMAWRFHFPIRKYDFKDDKTEENTFEILQHSDRNITNS